MIYKTLKGIHVRYRYSHCSLFTTLDGHTCRPGSTRSSLKNAHILNLSHLPRNYYLKGYPTCSSAARDGHATLTLTTLDKTNKRLEGTFSGVIYKHAPDIDSMVVTNGQFNIYYK